MTPADVELEELAAMYVLGELAADEARHVERQMAVDVALAAEVRRLRGVFGLLPYASITEPPPDLRDRIMDAAEAQHRRRRLVTPRRRRMWSELAAAAAAILAVVLGTDAYRVRQELRTERQVAHLLLEPNVVHSFAMSGGAVGTVALDLDSKRGAVVLRGAHALAVGQTYRLWAQVGERAVFCGDFTANPDGSVATQFAVPVDAYTAPIRQLFVTVEPVGPSTTPTGAHVMQSV